MDISSINKFMYCGHIRTSLLSLENVLFELRNRTSLSSMPANIPCNSMHSKVMVIASLDFMFAAVGTRLEPGGKKAEEAIRRIILPSFALIGFLISLLLERLPSESKVIMTA